MTNSHSRRGFVRIFALLTATSALPGRFWTQSVLAQADSPPGDGGVLRLKLSDFTALQHDFGSVRIGTSPVGGDHRPSGLFYPVLINRAPQGQFYALDTACSHEGCTVPVYDPAARLMQCPCHGSQYGIDGQVKRGPANFPLRQFAIHYDGADALAIDLPDISFSLAPVQVQNSPARIALEFIAFEQLEYEIRFRPTAADGWAGPVPFSLTPDGPATQTVIVGAANFARVYLDRASPSGLYAVTMRVSQV